MNLRIAAATLGCLLLAAPAFAKSKGGVTLPDTIRVGEKSLKLNGLGIREATVFNVDVYVAGLYLEKKTNDSKAILGSKDQTKRLIMKFVRDVDAEDMNKAWKNGFGKNSPGKVAKLTKWMSDLKEGDTIVITYEPEKGTTVSVKARKKGTIAGADFARRLFTIFIGPNPPNKGLKSGLLGK